MSTAPIGRVYLLEVRYEENVCDDVSFPVGLLDVGWERKGKEDAPFLVAPVCFGRKLDDCVKRDLDVGQVGL